MIDARHRPGTWVLSRNSPRLAEAPQSAPSGMCRFVAWLLPEQSLDIRVKLYLHVWSSRSDCPPLKLVRFVRGWDSTHLSRLFNSLTLSLEGPGQLYQSLLWRLGSLPPLL